MPDMGRRRFSANRDLEQYVKRDSRGYHTYLHPVMKKAGLKSESFGKDAEAANQFAREFVRRINENPAIEQRVSQTYASFTGSKTVSEVVELFKGSYILFGKWSAGYGKLVLYRVNRLSKHRGHMQFNALQVKDVKEILFDLWSGDGIRAARETFIHLFKFAIGEGFCQPVNYAELVTIPPKEKRKRARIADLDEYREMRSKCPEWLRDFADMALITLQRRSDLLGIKIKRDIIKTDTGRLLRIVQQKTGYAVDIEIGESLAPVVNRCIERAMKLGCPYLICAKQKVSSRTRAAKEHVFQILPGYATDQFKEFTGSQIHELRSLGEREYEKLGWTPEQIRALGGWLSESNRKIYAEDDQPKFVQTRADLAVNK